MKKGDIVIYKGIGYKLIWLYNSGFCEIQRRVKNEKNKKRVELVRISDILTKEVTRNLLST